MKHSIIKYLFAGALGLSITACKKSIEITPTHVATEDNAFKTVTDFQSGLSSIYTAMRGVGYYGRNLSVLADMNTDNLVQTPESLVNFLEITDWLYTPQNGTVAETWLGCYAIIRDANIIINNIDKFATTANQKQVNRIKG